ncbi:uncharacterized protein TrAFT101_008007 [Trichoderma asperellum]|uniref:uncharacterized protein n=1 Tax=Trichoderma asperellum TaxID=101201 RepID=UPI0033230A42|nr:hypothetical protein TrAFT101_008007 [Trichoderma asperellum]
MPQRIFERTSNLEPLKTQSKARSLMSFVEDGYVSVDWMVASKPEAVESWVVQRIRSLTNWFRLQHFVSDGYADLLGEEQRNSYRLLFDWWTAAYDRPATSLLYCSQLESVIHQNPRFKRYEDEYKELWICIQKHYSVTLSRLQPRDTGLDGWGRNKEIGLRNSALNDLEWFRSNQIVPIHSDYNEALYQLFLIEFSDFRICIDEANEDRSALRIHRIHAAKEAYYQQTSVHCSKVNPCGSAFLRGSFIPMLPSKNVAGFAHEYSWVCSVEASDPHFPQTIDCGPRIAACPWLNNKNEDPFGLDGWPEYLWHAKDRRLVRTRDLGLKSPAYTAISHTWGRWMSENDGCFVPNDLVCIPQGCKGETLDKEHSSLKQQEISRQGSIFRNARRTIAWFHDIDDFSCLEGLIEIAALSMIGVNKGLREATKHTREWRKARALSHMGDGPTGLFSQPKDTPKGPEFKLWSKQQTGHAKEMSQPVNFWFTSLWTLQELCLRPDMWLATSEWKFLCLEEHTLLPLNGVLCIFGKNKKSLSGERITEPCLIDAVSELRRWEVLTGLGELLSLRRVDILRLGDQRYCKEARSEAIMSVVGATRWYDRVVAGQYDPESDLILNKYCKEFINEVKRLIPTEFYTSYMKHVSIHEDGRMKAINPFTSFDGEGTARNHSASSSACICGSLMPFGKTGQRYRRSPAPGLSNMQAHNSVLHGQLTHSAEL